MNSIIKLILAAGKAPAIKKFGLKLVNQAMDFMKKNPTKVDKMKTSLPQEPASKLPIFEKLSPKFVGKGYKYDYLTKGTDITKGMLKNTTGNTRTSITKLKKK